MTLDPLEMRRVYTFWATGLSLVGSVEEGLHDAELEDFTLQVPTRMHAIIPSIGPKRKEHTHL
jgi:hypothetical protein